MKKSISLYFCTVVKYFLHISALFFVLTFGLPQSAQVSCCTGETTCEMETSGDHHEEPCSSSTCDCICCGTISILLLKKEIPEVEPQVLNNLLIFQYSSLVGSLFHSSIWQPPRLG